MDNLDYSENNNHSLIDPEEIDAPLQAGEEETSPENIKEPFDPAKINIITKPLTIDLLRKRLEEKEIDMDTGFQRKAGLWNDKKQSQLIESILIRLPLPAFYFDASNDTKWLVVDGLQRLSTLKNFLVDKTLALTNLEYLKQYDGKSFLDLPRELQRRIEETQITAFLISSGTPEQVKFNLFKRLNTGGLVLTPQEIRHALNQGIPADFVKSLAETPDFFKSTHNLISPERMEDRDFVTRALSFIHTDFKEYKEDLDDFLFRNMGQIGKISEQERQELHRKMIQGMHFAFEIFGEYAFRRRLSEKRENKSKINKALFEVWVSRLGSLDEKKLDHLVQQKDKLEQGMFDLSADTAFVRSISSGTGKKGNVDRRHREIIELIEKV